MGEHYKKVHNKNISGIFTGHVLHFQISSGATDSALQVYHISFCPDFCSIFGHMFYYCLVV